MLIRGLLSFFAPARHEHPRWSYGSEALYPERGSGHREKLRSGIFELSFTRDSGDAISSTESILCCSQKCPFNSTSQSWECDANSQASVVLTRVSLRHSYSRGDRLPQARVRVALGIIAYPLCQ